MRAVDHIDEEAVGDLVERLRDIHSGADYSSWGIPLVEACNHLNRDREQVRGDGVPRFEAMLGGAGSKRLHDGREE